MPINVTGSTDTQGAMSVMPKRERTICIVGAPGTAPSEAEKTIFQIYSKSDAEAKFGASAFAVGLVETLITNGITSIKGIIYDSAGATINVKYGNAFAKLLEDNYIDIILLDTTDATVHLKLGEHLDAAENEDIFRYGVVGFAAGTTNAVAITNVAAINNKRIFAPMPNTLSDAALAQSGTYVAAGLASAIAKELVDPALPLNGVDMIGFGGLERVLVKAEKNALINGGVVPMYSGNGNKPTIYRLVTTSSDPIWQEGTTVFVADDVLSSVQTRIKVNYKRTKNVERILKAIKTDVTDVLRGKNDLEIIENFNAAKVSVIKDPTDLYGALIDYEFDVVTPLYNITINQHMKL